MITSTWRHHQANSGLRVGLGAATHSKDASLRTSPCYLAPPTSQNFPLPSNHFKTGPPGCGPTAEYWQQVVCRSFLGRTSVATCIRGASCCFRLCRSFNGSLQEAPLKDFQPREQQLTIRQLKAPHTALSIVKPLVTTSGQKRMTSHKGRYFSDVDEQRNMCSCCHCASREASISAWTKWGRSSETSKLSDNSIRPFWQSASLAASVRLGNGLWLRFVQKKDTKGPQLIA